MAKTDKPNILFITTDRQRFDTLGAYGNEFVTTPNLDRLAREGIIFERAYSQCTICSPSRASFLTGRYPRTTRVNRNGQTIPGDEKLISRLLADAGYVCGHAGKLHIAPGSPDVTAWSERRIDDGYVVFDWSLHPPATPVCNYTAWLSEHNVEFKRTPVGDSKYVTFGMDKETSATGWIAQRAINFIKCNAAAEPRRPWFFTCSIEDPHDPYDPPREFLEPYLARLNDIPLPKYVPGELDTKPAYQRTDRGGVWGGGGPRGYFGAENMSAGDHRLIRAAYYAMVDHVDYQVGRIFEALRASAQAENTVIVFTSDHGEMMGDHGLYFQGPYFYEAMVHVPLIIWGPGRVKPVRAGGFVELVDLAPTLLDAAGLARWAGMQGRTLMSVLSGAADPSCGREDVYHEYYQAIPGSHKATSGAYITGLRSAEFAVSVAHNLGTGELYDLRKDPGEVVNLWDDPAYVPTKARLLQRLCDRMAATIDPLPPVEAGY